MALAGIEQYARERKLSIQDASQTFMQVVTLRNLQLPEVRLIGGAALVLGHENPRFSEDIDLTGVKDSKNLGAGLIRAARELERWFRHPISLTPPRKELGTWKITCRLERARSLCLHVDSQPYRAYTTYPIVIQYPSIPSFVFEGVRTEEIMSDKVVALACRRCLGGRDLFDLWFHWLRSDEWKDKLPEIQNLTHRKLKDRSQKRSEFLASLERRLSPRVSLRRAQTEWERYLPPEFQRESVQDAILSSCRQLSGILK